MSKSIVVASGLNVNFTEGALRATPPEMANIT